MILVKRCGHTYYKGRKLGVLARTGLGKWQFTYQGRKQPDWHARSRSDILASLERVLRVAEGVGRGSGEGR